MDMRHIVGISLSICVLLAVCTARAYEISFDSNPSGRASVVHKVPLSHCYEGVVERGNVVVVQLALHRIMRSNLGDRVLDDLDPAL